jgi:hypothetical protein
VSAVRANWHLDALDLTDDDPMQGDIADFAKPIDLSKSVAELRDEMQVLVRKEGRYARNGLTCDMKWTQDGPDGEEHARNPCYTCPQYTDVVEDMTSRGLLCTLGRKQNDVLDALHVLVTVPARLDAELVAAHERDAAEAEELLRAIT